MLASAASSIAVAQEKLVRMGNQKVGAFALLKARGILEERLKPLDHSHDRRPKSATTGPLQAAFNSAPAGVVWLRRRSSKGSFFEASIKVLLATRFVRRCGEGELSDAKKNR
jgi:hypothetical protein